MADRSKFKTLIRNLYATVDGLEKMFPERFFTPDGHMVGSIGECLVADAYGLKLMRPSNKGYDAVTKTGEKVEIKATQSDTVSFRSDPEHTIVIKILRDGSFREVYNGPGKIIWSQFQGKPVPSNGQYKISLKKLEGLNQLVSDAQRVPKIAC